MTQLEKVLFTAKAPTTGGRDEGASRTDDGRLQVTLSTPGTSGTGANPEQLFAAGWSACFLSAIKLVAGKKRIALPGGIAIDAEVETAHSLVEAAHHVCPYSLATSGSIDVRPNVIASQPADRTRETQHA
jgi:lipoyl-dependent peroxiredoxin